MLVNVPHALLQLGIRVVALVIFTAGANAQTSSKTDPASQALRSSQAVVQAVDLATARRILTAAHRTFEYCQPYADSRRTLVTDRDERVRMYERQAGSEDSALTFTHYYDTSERLRFVRITVKTTRGTVLLHRVYFDEAGKRILENYRYLKGPRQKFPAVWPVEDLQLSAPKKAFASPSPCAELQRAVK